MDSDILICEQNGWLLRRSSHMRDPMFWWNITENGRKALADSYTAGVE